MTTAIKERLGLFLALSRTPHGLIDMAAPALAALLCLGHFPSLPVILVGMLTVFAGYTAVYALNDLVDLRTDQQKVAIDACSDDDDCMDMDGVMMRHPMAKGALSLRAGLAWALGWAAVALAGAFWLNPVCLYIFLAGCALEAIYCKLLKVTPLRALINGAVKTLGSVAAVFAVDPSPSPLFLAALFAWLFTWEIGGQNIPNDWTDVEEDRRFKAQTIPVRLGLQRAMIIIVACLAATLFLNIFLLWVSPLTFGILPLIVVVAVNVLLLLHPAFLLAEKQQRQLAMALFNKASHYPLAMLGIVLVRLAY